MSTNEIPTGVEATVTSDVVECSKCDSVHRYVKYQAIATDERIRRDGVPHRLFLYTKGSSAPCGCAHEGIWLSYEDESPLLARAVSLVIESAAPFQCA